MNTFKVLAAEHRTELIDHKVFGRFYRFVYFVLRENGHRCLRMEVAIEAWTFVLRGRFRLLDRWTQFVYNNHKHAISEDTWRQVLDFSRCILEDLSNYDPDSAWPVLIDEFVDSLSSGVNAVDCTILQGSVPSGSKRRMKAETDTHVEEDVEGLRQKLAELTPSKPAKRRKGKTADQDEWSNHTASGNCASDFCVTMDSPSEFMSLAFLPFVPHARHVLADSVCWMSLQTLFKTLARPRQNCRVPQRRVGGWTLCGYACIPVPVPVVHVECVFVLMYALEKPVH